MPSPSFPIILFVSLSFFPSLILLTLYFSSILTSRSAKRTFYRIGFVISFSGLAMGAAFALAAPFFPNFIPVLDVGDLGIVFVVITWVLLLRHYCGTGWLESLPPAFIAVIIYVVIMAMASGFAILWLQT